MAQCERLHGIVVGSAAQNVSHPASGVPSWKSPVKAVMKVRPDVEEETEPGAMEEEKVVPED